MKTRQELEKDAADKAIAELEAAQRLARRPLLEPIVDRSLAQEAEKTVSVQGDDVDIVLQLYKAKYSKSDDYKEPTQNRDGIYSARFPSLDKATDFFMEAAEEKAEFVLVDFKTKTVMGYSNGDGNLYDANGDKCEKGGLRPSSMTIDKFTMPEKSSCRP